MDGQGRAWKRTANTYDHHVAADGSQSQQQAANSGNKLRRLLLLFFSLSLLWDVVVVISKGYFQTFLPLRPFTHLFASLLLRLRTSRRPSHHTLFFSSRLFCFFVYPSLLLPRARPHLSVLEWLPRRRTSPSSISRLSQGSAQAAGDQQHTARTSATSATSWSSPLIDARTLPTRHVGPEEGGQSINPPPRT